MFCSTANGIFPSILTYESIFIYLYINQHCSFTEKHVCKITFMKYIKIMKETKHKTIWTVANMIFFNLLAEINRSLSLITTSRTQYVNVQVSWLLSFPFISSWEILESYLHVLSTRVFRPKLVLTHSVNFSSTLICT